MNTAETSVSRVQDLPVLAELADPDWGADLRWITDDLFQRDYQGLMRSPAGDIVAYRNVDVGALTIHPQSSHQTLAAITTGVRNTPEITRTGAVRFLDLTSFSHRQPEHKPMKMLTVQRFTPKSIQKIRDDFTQILRELIEQAASTDAIDFVADFAFPATARFWATTIGMDLDEATHILSLAAEAQLMVSLHLTPEQLDVCNKASDEYLDRLIAALRRNAYSGEYPMVTDLVEHWETMDPESRPADPFGPFAATLIDAVHTVPTMLSLFAHALIEGAVHPAAYSSDPAKFGAAAFLEASRLHPPLISTTRQATEDFVYDDVFIPADTNIIMFWLFANRDPALFPDPLRFQLERPKRTKQLTFGGGYFGCSGRNLAKTLGETMLTELADNSIILESAGEQQWVRASTVHELSTLPVRVRQEKG